MALRILFPLDGSERSLLAMENALGMLEAADPEVTLLCVMHEGFHKVDEERVQEFDEDEHDEIFPTRDACDRMLDRAEKRCKKLGVGCARKVVEGKVHKEILRESGAHDLLVMHALDKGGLMEKVRMSGTERIARKAACSVLLVQDPPT